MTWKQLDTAGKLDALRAVYEPGMSASDIAAALSLRLDCEVSRNAVIGLYTRYPSQLADYQLQRPTAPKPKKAAKPRVERPVPQRREKIAQVGTAAIQRTRRLALAGSTPPPPVLSPQEYDATAPRIPLLSLTPFSCRWPVDGEREHTLFCGHPKAHRAYCDHHHRRATGSGTESERSAHRSLERQAA